MIDMTGLEDPPITCTLWRNGTVCRKPAKWMARTHSCTKPEGAMNWVCQQHHDRWATWHAGDHPQACTICGHAFTAITDLAWDVQPLTAPVTAQ